MRTARNCTTSPDRPSSSSSASPAGHCGVLRPTQRPSSALRPSSAPRLRGIALRGIALRGIALRGIALRGVALVCVSLLWGTSLTGCHSAPPVRAVGIDRYSPEKDVVVYQVALEELCSPRGYRDWAREQLDAVGGEPANERFPGIPIYEVTYRFRIGREIVAEVTFQRDEEGRGPLVHAQTIVRSVPDWLLANEQRDGN